MKLQIDKFLSLTAMIATAQMGAFACTAVDDAKETDEAVEGDDDTGADDDEGNADDDAADDDAADDDAADDDAADDDTGDDDGPASEGDDDVAAGDAGTEGGEVMADAGTEGGEVMADAGDDGVVWTDAGAEGEIPVGDDAGVEGGDICLDGSFDAASEVSDCAMFDPCVEQLDYAGTAGTDCWNFTYSRRASVYDAFIGCIMDADIVDVCSSDADATVLSCAGDADSMACADPSDQCAYIGANCSEVGVETCDWRLGPYDSFSRDNVVSCLDTFFLDETIGPDYEGCAFDFEWCISPSAE